jgi:hypothetical protein
MFEDQVLVGLRTAPLSAGATSATWLQLRLPWYRSLQLSCIEGLEITIDGEVQSEEELTIVIAGARHPLSGVASLRDVWWFVLDAVDVELATELQPGPHQVAVSLALQIPYGDADFRPQLDIKQVAECTRELLLPGKDE